MPREVAQNEAPRAPPADPATTPDPTSSRLRRMLGWAARHRFKAAAILAASIASIGGAVVLALLLLKGGTRGPETVTLDMALAALDRGAYTEAQHLAQRLRDQGTLAPNELGGPVFVLGAAAAYEARETWAKDRGSRYLVAAGYLDEARSRGFPAGRKPEGLLLLGESLFHSGQVPASRPMLLEALAENPQQKSAIHDMLAAAYFEDANPNLPEALKCNGLFLADKFLDPAQREKGLLRQAEIQLRMGNVAECQRSLDQVPRGAKNLAGVTLVRGQILMHQARIAIRDEHASDAARAKARQQYDEAIKLFRQAQGQDTLSAQATRKAHYLIGVCFLELGDYRAAAGQFERTRLTYGGTPEAVAASFQEAELARVLGHENEALSAYRRALRSVSDPKTFSNPWVSLDELRAKAYAAYQHYMDRQDFGVALQLVQGFTPLFPAAKKTLWSAETCDRWARALAAKAERLPHDQRLPLLRQARAQFRKAGQSYRELARLETVTRQYTDHLWSSAEAYLAGQDYRDAVVVLNEYLKNETKHRHSLALVKLGEALLALDRTDEALAALKDCVDFHPRDAAAFRARLLASRAYLEKSDLDKAEGLLEDNLNGVLSPSSLEWRQSLFALGRLLHVRGDYEKAVARLGEAVHRYPDAPEALEARYLMADACRRSAEALQEQLRTSQVRNARLARMKQIHESLGKAIDEYQRVQAILNERQQNGSLTPEEKAILRNSIFATGDVQFDLGKYDEAVETYTTAAYRYQGEPASLLAYLQMASAYERLRKPAEARNTLKQARVVVARIQGDAAFTIATPFSRKEWEQLIDKRLSEL